MARATGLRAERPRRPSPHPSTARPTPPAQRPKRCRCLARRQHTLHSLSRRWRRREPRPWPSSPALPSHRRTPCRERWRPRSSTSRRGRPRATPHSVPPVRPIRVEPRIPRANTAFRATPRVGGSPITSATASTENRGNKSCGSVSCFSSASAFALAGLDEATARPVRSGLSRGPDALARDPLEPPACEHAMEVRPLTAA